MKRLATPRFCRPADAPVSWNNVNARIYVLGPPPDEKLIKKYNPSKSRPETYGFDAMDVFLGATAPALVGGDPGAPFDRPLRIPTEAARRVPFFRECYWGEDADAVDRNQSWRRIDGSWLDVSTSLALQLDSATNNTCLVLAIELGNGDVLLFPADAEVGDWLSWQDLRWTVDGRTVTGPGLLERTIFYKVGHHGSHNATLREKGLELMTALQIAMIPVDHKMAVKSAGTTCRCQNW